MQQKKSSRCENRKVLHQQQLKRGQTYTKFLFPSLFKVGAGSGNGRHELTNRLVASCSSGDCTELNLLGSVAISFTLAAPLKERYNMLSSLRAMTIAGSSKSSAALAVWQMTADDDSASGISRYGSHSSYSQLPSSNGYPSSDFVLF